MRITESMSYDSINYTTENLEEKVYTASQEASTGLKIRAPGDDPTGMEALVRLGATEDRTNDYQSTITTVSTDAQATEGALASATDILAQAKEVAVQGATGTLQASDRAILATQVDGLFADLLSVANTKGTQGYLFAGTATATQPFTTTGTFVGNDQAHHVEIGQDVAVVANASGAQTFTAAGGTDVFATLTALSNALKANDGTAVANTVNALDAAASQISAAQADSGLLVSRLNSTSTINSQSLALISQAKSAVGGADLPTAYTTLTQSQTALTQAIDVSKQVMSTLGSWMNQG